MFEKTWFVQPGKKTLKGVKTVEKCVVLRKWRKGRMITKEQNKYNFKVSSSILHFKLESHREGQRTYFREYFT
jgi:hypothetical protein